ncbi:MAG: DUF3501 family protein [Alphaproteobacteria bacterium]|jgi:hypothetical protein|nr:DUF3501 family protein [Alphaproteobacteria bacterium]MBT7943372.1 DUF3501 family protein [Alphaproteobacteria bacterium]
MTKREITRADILPMDEYIPVRPDRKSSISALKKNRRVHVGPDATFYFESFDTMLHQVQEMLYIERGGEGQIDDELSAYNPLIPGGRELVATLMFEIDDPVRREGFLASLGGVENTVTLSMGGEVITAIPEDDVERTTADGKASSIQFLHFPFTDAQVEIFRDSQTPVTLGIGHAQYGHMANLPNAVRQALALDFD